MSDILFIDTQDSLLQFLATCQAGERLAVDTEFLRERTYHARLCLVQLAAGGRIACIDPLAGLDLEPLWQSFDRAELTLHAARQDLEVLLGTAGRLPARIFDTQVAAALCGYPAQIGYASLVRELLGIDLGKHHTRTDWSRRPLSARLAELGRLDWAVADSNELLQPALYDPAPEMAWQRLKGLARMDERSAAAAAALAVWREREALRADRPRQWILKDAALIALAQSRPSSRQALADTQGVPAGLARRAGDQLLQVIGRAGPSPVLARGAPSAAEKALVAEMSGVVRGKAEELGIEPELIASRKDLRRAAGGGNGLRALSGWRGELVGEALAALLGKRPQSSTAETSRS